MSPVTSTSDQQSHSSQQIAEARIGAHRLEPGRYRQETHEPDALLIGGGEPTEHLLRLAHAQQELTLTWIRTILRRRLPETPSDPLRAIDETSGWLGDRASGEAWHWDKYPGDRTVASWLPSPVTARQWEDLIAVR